MPESREGARRRWFRVKRATYGPPGSGPLLCIRVRLYRRAYWLEIL
jgi:hypothetical protein